MDWGSSSELQDIFRAEVADRSARLVEGANSVINGTFQLNPGHDLARDAHTIKGSARVMGFEFAAEGARLMEETWKALESGGLPADLELGQRLLAVAEAMPIAVDSGSAEDISTLQAAVTALDRHINGPGRGPGGGASVTPIAPEVEDQLGDDDLVDGAGMIESPDADTTVDLGGLLPSLHDRLVGGTTRVESPKLYQLINRAVEARLDARSLTSQIDKTLDVVRSGGDVNAAMGAWKTMVESIDRALDDVEVQALELASVRLKELTGTFPQLVRFVSRRTGKEIRFELVGDDIEVDRQILDRLHEPLRHLLVNAIDHGIEPPDERQRLGKAPTGIVAMRASTSDHRLRIVVEDDGRGIDWNLVAQQGLQSGAITPEQLDDQAELARLLYLAGFSTVPAANDISGDGSGLSAVAELAEELNGGIEVSSLPGVGTSVTLTLPASAALQDVYLVEAENQHWGIPATAVSAALPLASADIVPGSDRMELAHKGSTIPIASFAAAVGLSESEPVTEILVITTRLGQFGLTVPRIMGRRQVAVKGIGPLLGGVPHLTGAALLGGGRVVVIVEPNRIGDNVRTIPAPVSGRPKVLVVDDSRGVRQLVAAALSSNGFEVTVAGDAEAALSHLADDEFDALVVDYMMPGSDGVELVMKVRESHSTIKIVMVSGVAAEEDKDRAWSAGVNAYLDKFDLRQGALAATLRSLLGMSEETTRPTGLAM